MGTLPPVVLSWALPQPPSRGRASGHCQSSEHHLSMGQQGHKGSPEPWTRALGGDVTCVKLLRWAIDLSQDASYPASFSLCQDAARAGGRGETPPHSAVLPQALWARRVPIRGMDPHPRVARGRGTSRASTPLPSAARQLVLPSTGLPASGRSVTFLVFPKYHKL